MKGAYYNEFDRHKAAWLRELIKAGAIADGEVDERSIAEVGPDDVRGFVQCHWFAGIGIWSYALRLAGVRDDEPAWTASCPCQPFSQAGKRKGTEDRRHLWPDLFRILRERRPVVLFGEQVQSPDGLAWLDIVSTDLESIAYTPGATGLCSASVGSPHARNRLFFVGMANAKDAIWRRTGESADGRRRTTEAGRSGVIGELANSASPRRNDTREHGSRRSPQGTRPVKRSGTGIVGHADEVGSQGRSIGRNGTDERATGVPSVAGGMADASGERVRTEGPRRAEQAPGSVQGIDGERERIRVDAEEYRDSGSVGDSVRTERRLDQWKSRFGETPGRDESADRAGESGPVNGFWGDADWRLCRPSKPDGEWEYRPVKPLTQPMDDGLARDLGYMRVPCLGSDEGREVVFPLIQKGKARVQRLRGYGDGIVAQVAAEFIRSSLSLPSE